MELPRLSIAPLVLLLSAAPAQAITFQFDYSYDDNHFFSDSTRKGILEAAGSFFANRITDSLGAIHSDSSMGNHFDVNFPHPATGSDVTVNDFSVPADTLIVYAGGRDLTALGKGGPGGFSSSGTSDFHASLDRGQPAPNDFGPWGGAITFDTNGTNWFFDTTLDTDDDIPNDAADFYSVALHELGHLLGIGTADSWKNKVENGQFTGPHAEAVHGGSPVPLSSDGGHWAEGTQSPIDGSGSFEAAMDPSLLVGTRKVFTDLDLAGLKDVGWQVQTSPVPLPPAVWLFGSGLLALTGLRRRAA